MFEVTFFDKIELETIMIDYYGKYYLSSDKILEMLRSTTPSSIVFDTSALLALYFYSENTQNEIFSKIFGYCYDRLWIPAQAFFEYQKNHGKVSKKPIDTYKALIDSNCKDGGYIKKILAECENVKNKSLKNIEGQLNAAIEKTKKNDIHPYVESSEYDNLRNYIDNFKEQIYVFYDKLKSYSENYDQLINGMIQRLESSDDPVYKTVSTKFKIGSEFSYDQMMEIAVEGSKRYSEQIPPGYEDDEKIGLQKYGDLFFWKQLLKYANSKPKKDILLITNDKKEDWFEDNKLTPRFELLKEFNSLTGKNIWILSLKDFIFNVNTIIDKQLDNEAIDEVENMETKSNSIFYDLDTLENSVQTLLSFIDIWLNDYIPINDELRLFDKPVLYKAESSNQEEYRVVITTINGKGYARILHALSNPFEIKKYYQRNNERYRFINIVILRNSELTNDILNHLEKKTTKKNFNNKSIRTIICTYNDSGALEKILSNFD